MENNTQKIFKIYFWKIISMGVQLLSMLIVIPRLSNQPAIFGIYSICLSFTVFLSYADLGFIQAAIKYGAEFYAQKKLNKELNIIGFAIFILLVFLSLFVIFFLYAAFNPKILIKNIESPTELHIASMLLFIQAISIFQVVIEKINYIVLTIRLKNYLYQRILLFFNLLVVLSSFYFFSSTSYDIIGYFLFMKILLLLASIIGIGIITFYLKYPVKQLFLNIKFAKETFIFMKSFAINSIFITVFWVLYFELDNVVIGKWFGPTQVAIYAIGLTWLSLVRSVSGIIFSPFDTRFNHLVGIGKKSESVKLLNKVFYLFGPIYLLSIPIIIFSSKYIIITWVGLKYLPSVSILQYLVSYHLFTFFILPSVGLLIANHYISKITRIIFLVTVMFWATVYLLYSIFDFESLSFAMAKLITGLIYTVLLFKELLTFKEFVYKIRINELLLLGFLIFISFFFSKIMFNQVPLEKDTLSLIEVLLIMVFTFFISFSLYLLLNKRYLQTYKNILVLIKGRE